jgi:hypothetical protein
MLSGLLGFQNLDKHYSKETSFPRLALYYMKGETVTEAIVGAAQNHHACRLCRVACKKTRVWDMRCMLFGKNHNNKERIIGDWF